MTELKEGYKKTEIGVIPVEWDIITIGDCSKNFDGQRVPLKSEDRQQIQGDYPYYGAQGIIDYVNDYIFDGRYLLVAEDGENVKEQKYDIAFVVNSKFWVNNHTHILQENKNMDLYFISSVLNHMNIIKYVTGTGQPKLNKAQLNSIKIPLPPLKEQEKIADILSTADEKIDAIEGQIQKAQTLKKGLLQKLLSEGIGHSEFKDSELGKIPESWEVLKLGDIGSFKNGINKNKEDFGFGNKFFNLMDVFGLTSIKKEPIGLVNIKDKEKEDFDTQKGDTFFIRSSVKPSGVGLTAVLLYAPIDTVYSGFIIRFRDNNKFELNFKKYCFYDSDFRKRLLSKSSVSANTNINQEALKSLLIKLPPLEEQKQIAEILSTADEKLEVLRAKKEKYETLKKGLLQKLLSGEVRV